jgi:hypothetical protein
LYLTPNVPGSGSLLPVIIPAHEIKRLEPATLYWKKLVYLSIRDPPITSIVVQKDIFDRTRQYLDPVLLPAAGI